MGGMRRILAVRNVYSGVTLGGTSMLEIGLVPATE